MSDSERQQGTPANSSSANTAPQPLLPFGRQLPFQPSHLLSISTLVGPLPPPEILSAYDNAHPGAAKWILDLAEKNTEHVRDMDRRAARYRSRDALLQRLLPFLTVIGFLAVALLLGVFAGPYLGGAAFFATLGTVVAAYLKGMGRPAASPDGALPSARVAPQTPTPAGPPA